MASGDNGGSFRVVLLGKTGNGKSTLGNALLNQNGFKVGRGLSSETMRCAWGKAVRRDRSLTVTDTPGLCDTYFRESDVYKELAKSVLVTKPGPNVILFVLRAERRFTTEEYQAYETIKELFSDEINRYLILVFNGIDQLGVKTLAEQREALKEDIDKLINPQPPQQLSPNAKVLSQMMTEAGGRYLGLNNKTTPEEQEAQMRDLMSMMQDLVKKNGGAVYRTELTERINRKAEELLLKVPAATSTLQTQEGDQQIKIINEDVPSDFFSTLGNMISTAFAAMKRKIKEMCPVM